MARVNLKIKVNKAFVIKDKLMTGQSAKMNSSMEFMSIQKFVGKNYSQWRFQAKCALKAKGLFGYVDGTKQVPTNATELARWEKEDAMALFVISSALDYSQVRLIENCTKSKDALEKLDSIYKHKSSFSKMALLDQYAQLKMEKDEAIVQYISRVENLAQEITEAGEKVSEASIIIKIIGTLPEKFRGFRQAWLSMTEENQTMKNLISRLLDEESRLPADDN